MENCTTGDKVIMDQILKNLFKCMCALTKLKKFTWWIDISSNNIRVLR